MKMIEINEEAVRGTARVMGPYSAAARAVKDADERRAKGQTVKFYRSSGSIIVQGQDSANNGADEQKGGAK